MQLGTRWSAGVKPPTRLDEGMRVRIAEVEAGLSDEERAAWRWTLTWLEGRPVVESDSGVVLRG
jgi:hypothetical protein